MSEDRTCPRCGHPLPMELDPHRRGRRRVWCSDTCRVRAHAERAAAARAGLAVRVVEVPRAATRWPDWPPLNAPQSFALAAVDEAACVDLLDALTERVSRGTVAPPIHGALIRLLDALLNKSKPGPGLTVGTANLIDDDTPQSDEELLERLGGMDPDEFFS